MTNVTHTYFIDPLPLRTSPEYIFFYINITKNSLTGLLPLILLITFNFLVYKKLVGRRTEMKSKNLSLRKQHSNKKKSCYFCRHYKDWIPGRSIENWKSPGQNDVWRCHPFYHRPLSSFASECVWFGQGNPSLLRTNGGECSDTLLGNSNYFMNVKSLLFAWFGLFIDILGNRLGFVHHDDSFGIWKYDYLRCYQPYFSEIVL